MSEVVEIRKSLTCRKYLPLGKCQKMPNKKPRGDVYSPDCPSRTVLDHLFSRWSGLVLMALLERTYRFRELSRKVGGVSEKMLAQTLVELEKDGFVKRVAYPEIPPRVEYSLTPMGREAAEIMQQLGSWIEANLGRVMKHRSAA